MKIPVPKNEVRPQETSRSSLGIRASRNHFHVLISFRLRKITRVGGHLLKSEREMKSHPEKAGRQCGRGGALCACLLQQTKRRRSHVTPAPSFPDFLESGGLLVRGGSQFQPPGGSVHSSFPNNFRWCKVNSGKDRGRPPVARKEHS